MKSVKFETGRIWIDGKPVQIISGAIHYFRVPQELWRDRMEKMVQCGLNCIETYMCWNLHEPKEGTFDFSGMLDFEKFIRTAESLGLYVIVRPGPYICAEWDNGGLPAWLMLKRDIQFRRINASYQESVKNYYAEIMPRLRRLQYTEGGPVIAMQVENEYGSYGEDKEYLAWLRQLSIDSGITVPLFTADGAGVGYLLGGLLDGSPATLTFGSRPLDAFALGKKYRPEDPSFCMEFWNGWFDAWGQPHHTRDKESAANDLDDMLRVGGNVNFYMFHGGTNFAFTAGANGLPGEQYTPDVTSYDYDAPLSECGDATPKFFAFQDVIRKYRPDADFGVPAPSRKLAYGKIDFTETAPLFENLDNLSEVRKLETPVPMEKLGQNFGFIHYRTRLPGPQQSTAYLWNVQDRAQIYLDGKQIHTYFRNDKSNVTPLLQIPEQGADLDILVENMGRINYGPMTGRDLKGIVDGVSMGLQFQFGWEVWTLPMEDLSRLVYKNFCDYPGQAAFYKASFQVDDVADTFVKFPGVKGVIWINGHNIGRYWNIGPGNTLYVPAPFLRKGENEIVVFELEKLSFPYVHFVDAPNLG